MHAKQLGLILVLVLVAVAPIVAQEDGLLDDGATAIYEPGDFSPSIGVGFSWGFSPVIYPGVELILSEVNIEDTLPLSFGVAARGYLTFVRSFGVYASGWTSFGAGGFGTAHLSFKEVDADVGFLANFDFYAMLGLAFSYSSETFYYVDDRNLRLQFVSIGGTSYFLNERLALMAEGAYWGYAGATIGIRFLL